jgi:ABC-type branched-subunit amino acid transport system permease subunit
LATFAARADEVASVSVKVLAWAVLGGRGARVGVTDI